MTMQNPKVGRNDPCPCGSNKKYKKCCLDTQPTSTWASSPPVPAAVFQKLFEHQKREGERVEQYGQIRAPITVDNFHGYRMVAVGRRVCYSKSWMFFPDFLKDYLPMVFGKEWGEAELKKPFKEQHQVVQWRTKSLEFMRKQPQSPDGSYSAIPSGFMAAYLSLAYDLYIVEDNGRLDENLLERLRHPDQFQGARHELFSEATCLRAGFGIEHENEKDPTKRHAEFVATHKETGQKISVEAKSKHRPGILGFPGDPQPEEEVSLRFGSLLNDAFKKNPPHPLVIFLDTNLPPTIAERILRPASMEPFIPSRPIVKLLAQITKEYGETDPFSLAVLTNTPHHYGAEEEPDPEKRILSIVSQKSGNPAAGPEAIMNIHNAANLYGNIPNEFPESN